MFGVDDELSLLPRLAEDRPVFHSEADFQHALAWQAREARADLRVRLETPPVPGVHLDLLLTDPDDGYALAIELKYLTDKWDGEVRGERYSLSSHGARDVRGYDCIKDIARVERTLHDGYAHAGLVLVLTNDPNYWCPPRRGRETNAEAFRIHEGVTLAGRRAWGPRTGTGTMGTARIAPIDLTGAYPLSWSDFSTLDGRRGRFRYLPVPIAPAS